MAAAAPSQRPDLNPERADSYTKPRITHGVQYDRSTPRRLAVRAVKTQQALVAAVAEEGVKEAPKDFIVPSIDAVKPRTKSARITQGPLLSDRHKAFVAKLQGERLQSQQLGPGEYDVKDPHITWEGAAPRWEAAEAARQRTSMTQRPVKVSSYA